jgi:outer membrane protein assembly factor BamE (lipoprotein component of BamABCDE complex)
MRPANSALQPPSPARRLARSVLVMIGLVALPGCELPDVMSYPQQARGNRVDPERLDQLVVGTATRADALTVLGSPTAKASFDDNTWLYISEMTKPVIAATNAVRSQAVVLLTFDTTGVLRKAEKKTMKDGYDVGMAAGATPSPGNETTFLQELLGNIGRFNAATGSSGANSGNTSRSSGGNY